MNSIYLVTLSLACLDYEPFWSSRDHLAFTHKCTEPGTKLVLKIEWMSDCVADMNKMLVIWFSEVSYETIFGLDPSVIKHLERNAYKVSGKTLENLFENPDEYGAEVVSGLTFIINGFVFQNTV